MIFFLYSSFSNNIDMLEDQHPGCQINIMFKVLQEKSDKHSSTFCPRFVCLFQDEIILKIDETLIYLQHLFTGDFCTLHILCHISALMPNNSMKCFVNCIYLQWHEKNVHMLAIEMKLSYSFSSNIAYIM